jgi:hypothetical protein
VTVLLQVVVVYVMSLVPTASPVTRPLLSTEAILGEAEVQGEATGVPLPNN